MLRYLADRFGHALLERVVLQAQGAGGPAEPVRRARVAARCQSSSGSRARGRC